MDSSFFLISCNTKSQETQKTDDSNWDAYIANYENGAGSTTLNMDLKKVAPKTDLAYILITGVTFSNCNKDGFPEKEEFSKLYEVSDEVETTISKITKTELAGTFTYQCERLNYYYINDTTQIRSKLTALYKNKYSNYKYYINIKPDKNWDAYLNFLYPNEEIQENMSNQKVIEQLKNGGDDLTKSRQVDHWIYFSNEKNRDLFEKRIAKNGFKIENKEKIDDPDKPFKLHISRDDKVDSESISKITLELRKRAKELEGDYDGWETYVVK
ncbi:DUF695 domain-containing protein [Flavobacterium sp. ST-87]|uniref:DUF695 domain-containing protein n=1 Tax=Flavobacterium plantiphilum TaxID=3163297 RepID=A0ABW8XXE2_9FLAO